MLEVANPADVEPFVSTRALYIDLAEPGWGLDASVCRFLAPYSDGTCLIAHEKSRDVEVRRILELIEQRNGKSFRRLYRSLDEIAEARRVGLAGRRGQAEGGMQAKILDLIEKAHGLGASDIHIEVGAEVCSVDFRVDGRLGHEVTWPADFGTQFLGAAYAMADVASASYSPAKYLGARLAPRQGRDDWAFSDGIEAVRMQFDPVAFGTNFAAFRLLTVTNGSQSIEQLGYEPEQLNLLLSCTTKSQGLVLIAGPTGSGKSTSVCALLMRAMQLDKAANNRRRLITVEDPPERRLPGAIQFAVNNHDTNEARSKAFTDAIRAAMRSDPDQLFIGEIRDHDTAHLALSGARTGHQVFSTVHCTSAHAIPMRLVDLGIDRSDIFGSDEMYLAVAQVLVPLLCQNCKIDADTAKKAGRVSAIEAASFERAFGRQYHLVGAGCAHCNGTGVKNRTVLSEVIRTDAGYLEVLSRYGIPAAREYSVKRGEPSIAQVGQRKVRAGLVSAQDAARVINLDELHFEIERAAA